MRLLLLFLSLACFLCIGDDALAAGKEDEKPGLIEQIIEVRWFIMRVVGVVMPIIGLLLWWSLRLQDKVNRKSIAGYRDQERQNNRFKSALSGGKGAASSNAGRRKSCDSNLGHPTTQPATNRKPTLFGKGKVPAR